jgi:hypothetical protein
MRPDERARYRYVCTGNTGVTNSAAVAPSTGVAARAEANACNVVCERSIEPCISVDCVSAERVKKPKFVKSELKYVDVVINGQRHSALIDGGAEMPLIKESSIFNFTSVGSVSIQPIVGDSVEAKLAALDIARFNDRTVDVCVPDNCAVNKCENGPLHLLFAVTDLASQEVVRVT